LPNIESELNPLAVTFQTGKRLSGLGLTTLWKLGKEGRIELVRVGKRTLITFRSLEALLTPSEKTPQTTGVSAATQPRRKRGRPPKAKAEQQAGAAA
jgi:hypothetical protein